MMMMVMEGDAEWGWGRIHNVYDIEDNEEEGGGESMSKIIWRLIMRMKKNWTEDLNEDMSK